MRYAGRNTTYAIIKDELQIHLSKSICTIYRRNMRNLLIGSRALAYWFSDLTIKDTSDVDIITNRPGAFVGDYEGVARIEWHDPWLLNNLDIYQYVNSNEYVNICGQRVYVVTPVGLAVIKRSHLHRDLKWNKHITHYHKYLQDFEIYFDNTDEKILAERTAMTMKLYPQGNPNLMQSKEDFFDDSVKKIYSHDYLHELYAHYDKPLYNKLLRHADLAWCEKSKWLELSHEDKLKCIQEEVYVIATERYLVRNQWEYPAKKAYMQALQKVCTTLCSGWFRDYSIDHYPELLNRFDASKVENVKSILTKGSTFMLPQSEGV